MDRQEIQSSLKRIHRRQVARFLCHLAKTGALTPEIEADVKRAYGYVFEDVEKAITGHDKDTHNGEPCPHNALEG